jgi:pantoate--beta-alanine ligase
MAEALFVPTTIVACPTVRESDGLAISSRNRGLSAGDRERAAAFYRVLSSAVAPDAARDQLRQLGFAVDYLEERDGRRLGAIRIGGIRLIDNVPIGGDQVAG